MNAFYYWKSKEFNLLNVYSALTLSFNTSVENIYIYHDIKIFPNNIYWYMLNYIPKIIITPVQSTTNGMVHIDSPIDMKSIFEYSTIAEFLLMQQSQGLAVSFDSLFLKDICDIKRMRTFFGNEEIYPNLFYFRENNWDLNKIVKRIAKEKYTYEKIFEFINKKFKNKKNIDTIWLHTANFAMPKNVYVVNMNGADGFSLFDEDNFYLKLHVNLFKSLETLLNKCQKKENYKQIAQAISL